MRLDHILVLVRSLDTSLRWYDTILAAMGFDKAGATAWSNGTVEFNIKEAQADTPDYERYAPGLNHIGFTADDRAAFDRVREAMATAGYDVPEIQTFGPMLATFFKDPDGMRLEVAVYS